MATSIRFSDIKKYLSAIAAKAKNPIDGSPHGAFWEAMDYATFTTGTVPNVGVQIIDTQNPLQSPILLVLTGKNAVPGIRQMPGGGPYITDAGYTATLTDGTTITGQQILDNMREWLSNGFPQ
jgi:hypothetical protein